MTYRKKLIEVALPLKGINEASVHEKAVPRHGHPATLHLWWARRPLAACRAVLFASLVDDPDSDPAYMRVDGTVDEERAGIKRADLFNLIDELVKWENSNNPRIINKARAEIARCIASRKIELKELQRESIVIGNQKGQKHSKGASSGDGVTAWEVQLMKAKPEVVNEFLGDHAPPILDPFCGGGSIPLEAQRLGLRGHGSDLNPVPVLITKALIEIPPKFAGFPPANPEWQGKTKEEKAASVWHVGQGLAEDIEWYGKQLRDSAYDQLKHLYSGVTITREMGEKRPDLEKYEGKTLNVIAWLWTRTVRSPNPAANNAHVPLVSTFWLRKKKGKEVYLEASIDRDANRITYEVVAGRPSADRVKTIDGGTKIGRGCTFRCILTGEPIPEAHVKQEGMEGRLGLRLLGIVADGDRERVFISPLASHEALANAVQPLPKDDRIDVPISLDKRALWCLLYGVTTFRDTFTPRQFQVLTTLTEQLKSLHATIRKEVKVSNGVDGDEGMAEAYADAVCTYLAFSIDKLTDWCSTFCSWIASAQRMKQTFSRQALPMQWDFAESNPFSTSVGNFQNHIDWVADAVRALPANVLEGKSVQMDATSANWSAEKGLVVTDPPYYDNIGYSDLSDYFYVWLRQSLGRVYPQLFSTLATPKSSELIAAPYRFGGSKAKAKKFFESGLFKCFASIKSYQNPEYPFAVFYAFKQAETGRGGDAEAQVASTGWETMLQGLCDAGFQINGTWPMRTERDFGVKSGTNVLASSIILSCRPRPGEAPLTTRRDFIGALRGELPNALRALQHGNVAPVDLAQAAIGPGMAVFTRYSKVMETDGSPMLVRSALGIINQVLDEVLAEQEGDFDADTRWALSWYEQFGVDEGPFGVAETLSKAKNTAVNALVEAGIISARGGKVRLVRREELNGDWDPTTDKRLTAWEITQHLIRILQNEGETAAAQLVHKLGGLAETARELAYRLYSICERKKWADEALAYNGLVIAWPELFKLSLAERSRSSESQQDLFSTRE